MSRLFDLVATENGKNMAVDEEVDLSPVKLRSVDKELKGESKPRGIRKILKKEGNGDDYPNSGDKIKIKYKAYLGDEIHPEYFFEEKDLEYEVCRGTVVRGFEYGVLTMKKDERSEIYLQPEYAYGKAGAPPQIPPDSQVIFDVTLLDIQCPDLSEEKDRSILKKTIVKGKGWKEPSEGCMIKLKMKGWYADKNDERVEFVDKEVYYPFGEGSYDKYDVPKFIEDQLHNWKKKETARLFLKSRHAYGETGNEKLGIPSNTDLTYIVELLDFEKEDKDVWEMNNQEKLESCEKLREKGNFYFKEKKMELAYKFYSRIVEIVGFDLCMKDDEEKQRKEVLHKGYLNLAQVSLNLEKYREAKDVCDKYFMLDGDKNNVKAYFRRGQALYNLQDWKSAKSDFDKVLEMEPTNKLAKRYSTDCQNKAKETAGQEKELAQKMMSGFGKGVGLKY
ncbi:FK506-binding protein 5 [Mactra antiquata]